MFQAPNVGVGGKDHGNRLKYIECIGIDLKQHVCEPHKDNCKCGVRVKRKTLLKKDYKLFSCYECNF